MKIECAGISETGKVREDNQDAIYLPSAETLPGSSYPFFALADGMGGLAGGSIASNTTLEVLTPILEKNLGKMDWERAAKKAVNAANQAIAQKAAKNSKWENMGTTLVLLVINQRQALVGNVGDSRLYHCRAGLLKQITVDHNLVTEKLHQGLLSAEEARNHKLRNVLTRALGPMPNVELDLFRLNLRSGDIMLLCSDGLHGVLSERR